MKTFETERIILKPTTKEDAQLILDLFTSPKWIQFIEDYPIKTIKETEDYIETKMSPKIQRLGYGNYTISRKFDRQKIGACALYDHEGVEGIAIGFALLPNFENKGYAFESVNKLKEVAFSHFQLKEISAITSKDNKASQKLLLKIGLDFEKNIKLPNEEQEILLYKLKL